MKKVLPRKQIIKCHLLKSKTSLKSQLNFISCGTCLGFRLAIYNCSPGLRSESICVQINDQQNPFVQYTNIIKYSTVILRVLQPKVGHKTLQYQPQPQIFLVSLCLVRLSNKTELVPYRFPCCTLFSNKRVVQYQVKW